MASSSWSSSHRRAESSPLLGLRFADSDSSDVPKRKEPSVWALCLSAACVLSVYLLRSAYIGNNNDVGESSPEYERIEESALRADKILSTLRREVGVGVGGGRKSKGSKSAKAAKEQEEEKKQKKTKKSQYKQVQTLSFQIHTGGAPAFVVDEATGKHKKNHECNGLHSYGLPADSDSLQCYLGLEDTAEDVRRRLSIMEDAVEKAYHESSKEKDVLKIFLAPEFFFRGLDGAYEFLTEEEEEETDACSSDICHILKRLEEIAANKKYEDWLFLFGTVIASETLPNEDQYDYQFYNFAPLMRGFDPAASPGRVGKNFLVPKRYVSNIDFLTPLRHLTNRTMAMELLDAEDQKAERTLMNPHAHGIHKYDDDVWFRYEKVLEAMGYNMIEYGWFFMDGIAFSVEICLDHLVHRALMTHTADTVTGSETLVPSSSNDSVEWVPLPRRMAQVSLVSSAGMELEVASLALADGGYAFLQDGVGGAVAPHTTFGENNCKPNQYEFYGGSQSVKRSAVISATDVTFEYELNMNYKDYDLYPDSGSRGWKEVLRGVFSVSAYQPKLTIYVPVDITL